MRFAEVAVDAPFGPGQTFTYSVPPSQHVGVGQLVGVPFGPRRLQGVVFALSDAPQVPDTRDLVSVDEDVPALTSTQLDLAAWMSGYYICSLFEAAQTMLPPGRRARLKAYFSALDGDVDTQSLPALQGRVLAYLHRRGEVAEARVVAAFGPGASGALRRLERKGLVARADRRSAPSVTHKMRRMVRLSAARPEVELSNAPRQSALLERLVASGGPMPLSEANLGYGASAVKSLVKKGVVETYDVRVERDPLGGLDLPTAPAVTMTMTQEKAAAEIRRASSGARGARRRFLLEGVTGSGKTEVYLDAVRHCLQIGKRAIVLVPEIALTHQTVERFSSRFPGRVAVIHSGLTAGQRFDQWHRVREGRYGVVVGSRGAVFAPQPDLGLIVLDEEHEWTYKQHDAAPRYHARDVALKLGELTGAPVILGSATPALETRHKALRGEIRPLLLPTRVSAGGRGGDGASSPKAMARVQIVDMRRELREGHTGTFSRALADALGRSLEDGGQTILFLNRRGSASYLQCRGCGQDLKCRGCDTPTAYHRDIGLLLCHYCGARRKPPTQCPACMSYRLSYFGIGTKAVVDEVERLFPGTPILRWDRDAVTRPGQHMALLERFRSGEAPVLVGTQMIAKGLHFPGVTLVGVVLADVGLNAPDFRAGERAFQVLCQVAGRAGRGPRRGRVIVQTYRPENYAIRAAASQDSRRFFAREMAHRREQGNPPYAGLIRLMNVHTNAALCEREALRLAEQLGAERDASGHAEVEVLGPTPAYPSRLRGRYRWQILLRGPNPRVLLKDVRLPRAWTIDVDPLGSA